MKNVLFVVVPCYNEEECLRETARKLGEKVNALAANGYVSETSKIVFVDDGSGDSTWDIVCELCETSDICAGIGLSRNRGHQYALLAGLMAVKDEADMVISIDADLQDDINAIDIMVDNYISGSEIVYGVRRSRKKDSFFKRATAEGYYKLLKALGCDIVFNHADFRLMSSRALEALSQYGEQSLFLRGLVPMLGFKTSIVEYDRGIRETGESKYPTKRMLALALDGIVSLTLRPLRFVMAAGAIMLCLAFVLLIFSIVTVISGQSMLNWKIVTISIWGVGGFLMLALGIVGEYVGRAYMEVKLRPRFNIEKTVGLPNSSCKRPNVD